MRLVLSLVERPPPGVLRYSGFLKGYTLVLGVGIALLALFAWWSKGTVLVPLILWPGLWWVEFRFVQHTYDAERVKYRTPWTRERSLLWAEVTRIQWSKTWSWLVLRDTHGATFRFSNRIGGLEGFADMALRRLPPEVLQASPKGAAALEMMRDGKALRLSRRGRRG